VAYWREGGKTRNVHLGSAGMMDAEAAQAEGEGDEGGGAWNREHSC